MKGLVAALGVGAAVGAVGGVLAWVGALVGGHIVDGCYRAFDYWMRKRHET